MTNMVRLFLRTAQDDNSMIKLSKKMCYFLRHNPASIGLRFNENGYTGVEELLIELNKNGVNIDEATLKEIVGSDKKERFSFSKDKTKIRANYGHSFAVNLGLKALCPPPVLYHGTGERNVESILKNGLNKAKRNYVHLTDDMFVALSAGKRYGNPVVFKVDSAKMFSDGFVFYKSGSVWLTAVVRKEYLRLSGNEKGT